MDVKGKIDAVLFAKAYHYLLIKEQAGKSKPFGNTDEGLNSQDWRNDNMNNKDGIIDSCILSDKMKEYLRTQILNSYQLTEIIAGSLLKLEEKIKLHTLLIKKKRMTRKRTIRMNRNNTCCFTGHRPEIITATETRVYEWLETQVQEAASNGYVNFISGMQRGVDIYAAEIVLKLKKEGLPINLICACAWNGMEAQWEQPWIDRYNTIKEFADEVHYVSSIPGRKAFFARDCWMVDHSSLLLAVYNGKNGGTKHTIDYARQKGLEVRMMKNE